MPINRTKQARQMLKKGTEKPIVQGGVENYLGKQPEVQAPRKWQSSPDAPPTELAYITKAEKDLILEKDIHGSLDKGPNMGPSGIMSLDSFGDIGGAGAAGGDTEASGGAMEGRGFSGRGPSETKSQFDSRVRNQKEIMQKAEQRQAKKLGFRERKNVVDMNRPGRFGFNPLATLLGFINPALGFIARGIGSVPGAFDKFKSSKTLAEFFNKINEPKTITEEDDSTLLDNVDPSLPFSKTYIEQLKNKMPTNLNDLEGLSKLDFIGRENLNDLEGLSKLDFIGRENLNDLEGVIEDKGLTVAPGSIIDEGIMTASAKDDFLDNARADVSKKDLDALKMRGSSMLDLDTFKTITGNSTLTQEELDAIRSGEITQPTGQFAADGGRINAMGGGIMDLETARQVMFLGGIAKGIKKVAKKATRAVKKVAKSPIGKAAILGAGLYFSRGFGGGILEKFKNLKPFQQALIGVGVPAVLAGLTTPKQEDEEFDLDEYYKQTAFNPNAELSKRILGTQFAANGGRIGYAEGSKEPVAKKVMPLLDMDGMEKDYRAEGGFVPIGRMEKADDVPARLSKNEFVFTADAVRNAGEGDVDKGAEVMYNMMKNLEAGGEVSEESQGLEGAREMFQTSQRLGEVI